MLKRNVERNGDSWEPAVESFTDDQTGAKYRRIVGGLAWPYGGKPGFAVVIAEDFEEDKSLTGRHLWVLNELEAPDVADLVGRCQDLRDTFQARDWFGTLRNKSMLAVLYHLQKDLGHKDRFSFSPAPHADDSQGLGYYLPVIKEHLRINRKILHFGKDSKMAGYVAQVGPEALNQDPIEYPPIAALGYALSYLVIHKPEPVSPKVRPTYSGPGSWMAS